MSTKVLLKQHIAHIFFAASAVLARNLPTNWLPVKLCRFCRFSLREDDDLRDLVFGLAIVVPWSARLVPGRKPNLGPPVRIIGRRRRRPPLAARRPETIV